MTSIEAEASPAGLALGDPRGHVNSTPPSSVLTIDARSLTDMPLLSRLARCAALAVLLGAFPGSASAEPFPSRASWAPLPPLDAEDRSRLTIEERRFIRSLWPDLPTEGVYQYFHWAPRWIEWLRLRGEFPGLSNSTTPADVPSIAILASPVLPRSFEPIDVPITATVQAEAESFVAIDPDDPRFVVAAANDFSGPQGHYASSDGGLTWTVSSMPLGGFPFHSDPAVGWDTGGNAYSATLGIKGGTIKVIVSKSTDRGLTWARPVEVPSGTSNDKELLWVDNRRESPCRDFIYLAWDIPGIGIRFSRSIDGAATFSQPAVIDRSSGIGTTLASGPSGEVIVAWSGFDKTIRTTRSLDCGLTFEEPRILAVTNQAFSMALPSFCKRTAHMLPALDIDRSVGCARGTVHVTWADSIAPGACASATCPANQACTTDIFYSRSTDGGLSWSPRRIVHEDLPMVDQFNPWLAVDDSDGSLWIAFQDTRLDATRVAADVFMVRSTDGGVTFSPSVRVTSSSTEQVSAGSSTFQWGDYNGLAAAAGRVVAVWTDRRPGSGNGPKDEIRAGVVTADPAGCLSGDFTGGGAVPLN